MGCVVVKGLIPERFSPDLQREKLFRQGGKEKNLCQPLWFIRRSQFFSCPVTDVRLTVVASWYVGRNRVKLLKPFCSWPVNSFVSMTPLVYRFSNQLFTIIV